MLVEADGRPGINTLTCREKGLFSPDFIKNGMQSDLAQNCRKSREGKLSSPQEKSTAGIVKTCKIALLV